MEEIEGRYCRGTQAEIEDMLDFANMVFSMHYRLQYKPPASVNASSDKRRNQNQGAD